MTTFTLFAGGGHTLQGQIATACEKLEESQRLDPAAGTRLNLAVCRERQGKVATAWSLFKLALAEGRSDQRPDRISFSEQHLAALEPRLPFLTVTLAPGVSADGLSVVLDGIPFALASIGVALPVDPGTHQVTLTTGDGRTGTISIDARESAHTRDQKSVV